MPLGIAQQPDEIIERHGIVRIGDRQQEVGLRRPFMPPVADGIGFPGHFSTFPHIYLYLQSNKFQDLLLYHFLFDLCKYLHYHLHTLTGLHTQNFYF